MSEEVNNNTNIIITAEIEKDEGKAKRIEQIDARIEDINDKLEDLMEELSKGIFYKFSVRNPRVFLVVFNFFHFVDSP